jgi:hypothetical protein
MVGMAAICTDTVAASVMADTGMASAARSADNVC